MSTERRITADKPPATITDGERIAIAYSAIAQAYRSVEYVRRKNDDHRKILDEALGLIVKHNVTLVDLGVPAVPVPERPTL